MTKRNTGHLRTSSLDEIQAEDRQSRQSADIRITFITTGFELLPWQRGGVGKDRVFT